MNGFFNPDAPLWRFMGRAGDLIMLNIIFLISCLPVVTIGASISALYSVVFRMRLNRECYLWKDFWRAFKENFKNSTIIWLLYVVFVVTCVLNFNLMINLNLAGKEVVFAILGAALAVITMIVMYAFPMQAVFENKLTDLIMRALMTAIARFPYTLLQAALFYICLATMFVNTGFVVYGLMVCLFIGFALYAWVSGWIFMKAFKKLITEEEWEAMENDRRRKYKTY